MKIRKIAAAALATVALAAGLGAVAPSQAEASTLPGPRPEVPNEIACRPTGGHWTCLIWQYRCPGEPFPPLAQGAIPQCKRSGVYARKYVRIIRFN